VSVPAAIAVFEGVGTEILLHLESVLQRFSQVLMLDHARLLRLQREVAAIHSS